MIPGSSASRTRSTQSICPNEPDSPAAPFSNGAIAVSANVLVSPVTLCTVASGFKGSIAAAAIVLSSPTEEVTAEVTPGVVGSRPAALASWMDNFPMQGGEVSRCSRRPGKEQGSRDAKG